MTKNEKEYVARTESVSEAIVGWGENVLRATIVAGVMFHAIAPHTPDRLKKDMTGLGVIEGAYWAKRRMDRKGQRER